MKKVIVIVGPTASGKSELAVKLATALHGEIINGDSVQVYRGLDIGSAKIKPSEQHHIKHHLIDIRDPKDHYSVYHFQQDARALIEEIDVPIIAGGTGLYIKAALYDYVFDDPERDRDFEVSYQNYTNAELAHLVKQLDPNFDTKEINRRRLLRALAMASFGSPRSQKQGKNNPLYKPLILYLDIERDLLEARLKIRLEEMFDEGLMTEVKTLHQKDLHINAIGYRELDQHLLGMMDIEEAKQAIIKHSKRLAKKQKTWFKNQMDAVIMDATNPHLFEESLKLAKAFLQGD